jgi:hypothetical protein
MKLQGSEVQDHETLQSQIGKIAENRLPLSGLEIFHGRLLNPNRGFQFGVRHVSRVNVDALNV